MERAADVRAIAEAHRAAGGAVYLVTCTVPHDEGDRLEPMRRAVADAWRYIHTGRGWIEKKTEIGYVGEIRAAEATVGAPVGTRISTRCCWWTGHSRRPSWTTCAPTTWAGGPRP